MTMTAFVDFLIFYLGFVVLLTFHEFAHAWVALKCGDDTAQSQGRVSLNPIVHLDMIGTVVMPLVGFVLAATGSGLAGFVIGWAKPVPVNIHNLRQPRLDDTLIAIAGPMMNLLLAAVLVGLIKLGVVADLPILAKMCHGLAVQSLLLCFFNLLPFPPLDGSHVVKNLVGMSYETYWKLCQYGFIIVIVAWQIPAVPNLVYRMTKGTFAIFAGLAGLR